MKNKIPKSPDASFGIRCPLQAPLSPRNLVRRGRKYNFQLVWRGIIEEVESLSINWFEEVKEVEKAEEVEEVENMSVK